MGFLPDSRADRIAPGGALRVLPGFQEGDNRQLDEVPFLISSDLLDVATASSNHFIVPCKGRIIAAFVNLVSAAASSESGKIQFGTQGNNTKFGTFTWDENSSTGWQDVTSDLGTTDVAEGDIVRLGSDGGATTSKNGIAGILFAPRAD